MHCSTHPCLDNAFQNPDKARAHHQTTLKVQVGNPTAPPVVLRGHGGEVSAVAWNPRCFDQVVTCGDDARVRVWSIDRDAAASRKPAAPPAKVDVGLYLSVSQYQPGAVSK